MTFLITDLELGGVPLHLYRLARGLAAEGVAARVIALSREGPVGAMLRQAGVPVTCCNARRASDVTALWHLASALRRDPPDILHAMLFHANLAARVIGPPAGIPPRRIITEIQTVEIERPWHLRLDGWTCRLCRFEVGNSPSVVAHLHARAGIPLSRLRCVWGAVDVEAIAQARPLARAELDLPEEEPVVLWTGRLDPVKGFEQMLGAFAQVLKEIPAHFVLAGEGEQRPVIEARCEQLGIADRVHLLGARNDIPNLLKTADVFLLCSRTEGLPNSLLEAMAAGLPVVVTHVSGCRDVVINGVNGIEVPLDDERQTAQAVVSLLRSRARARALGEAAQSWVRRRLNLSDLAGRWREIYTSILL